jgi:hypothetical protein
MKFHLILTLVLLAVLTTGCPHSIFYPLDNIDANKIDNRLLGIWINAHEGASIKKINVVEASPTQYDIEILEHDTLYYLDNKFKAWVTTIKEWQFIYLKGECNNYWNYQYRIDGGDILTDDICLLDGGIDALIDIESLRRQVEASIYYPEWGQKTQIWRRE